MNYGYNFYFKDSSGVLTFPITPGELSIKIGSNNKVVTLIDEGDVNILKSPSLIEVSFDARFPMRKYPYSRNPSNFESYFSRFKALKENRQSFRFIVARTTPGGVRTWDTNLLMALEDLDIKESSDEGDDVIVSFKLRQYKPYGIKTIACKCNNSSNSSNSNANSSGSQSTSTAEETRSDDNRTKSSKAYTVKSGDCLWNIAKKYYGDGSKWKTIYNANKSTIESTAKKYGKSSSSNGHWIYPDTKLTIPSL